MPQPDLADLAGRLAGKVALLRYPCWSNSCK